MISAIVYGRNDNHGYGMVKRVAIGLNALATQVDEGAGEIIFVDYNTPDHLPTLPELIWDTLTAQTLRRLRVLRVRPQQHARFARFTPLPVIEAVARNVALRRSNPNNRWVLSTNTDAMVAPRGGRPLSGIVSNLPDGIYGLPRYELPERSWESFNRSNPEECLSLAAEWADQARLREIVYGTEDVLYDNPGDFQLMPRFELLSIGGFEEEMLLGWHVDRNIAKRVSMRLGPVRGLSDQFDLYHLGHSRSVVATHAQDKIENDTFRFVTALDSAVAMHRLDEWGMAHEAIEEISLDIVPGEQVRSACRAIMKPLGMAKPEVRYKPESFDTIDYDAGRVAAHILDLVSPYSASTSFAYCGVRKDFFAQLRQGLAALGFSKKILVPQRVAAQLDAGGLKDVQIGDDQAVLATGDVLLFEFGNGQQANNGGDKAAEASVDAADRVAALLSDAVQIERRRPPYRPRRLFVAVNAVHTRFDTHVDECISAGASPFTTRLRYGQARALAVDGGYQTGSTAHPEETAHALDLAKVLADDKALDAAQRLDVAAHADLLTGLVDGPLHDAIDSDQRARLHERIAQATRPAPELAGWSLTAAPAERSLSGPARSDAWNDRDWASIARYFSPVRNGWVWERAQILQGVTAALRGTRAKPVLLVCEHPDRIVNAFAARLGSVDVLDVRELLGEPLSLAEASLSTQNSSAGKIRHLRLEDAQKGSYGAIVMPHAGIFRGGVAKAGRIIGAVQPLLAAGGMLAIGGEVSILGKRDKMRPSIGVAEGRGFPALLGSVLGLHIEGDAPYGLRERDLSLVGTREQRDSGLPVLAIAEQDDVLWPHVWFFTKSDEAPDAPAAKEIDMAFQDLFLGEHLDKLSLGSGAVRAGGVITNGDGVVEGHAVFGPYSRLKEGRYRLVFAFDAIAVRPKAPKDTRLVMEVSADDATVVQHTHALADIARDKRQGGRTSITLDFELAQDAESIEIRLWTNGFVDFTLRSVALSRS